MKNFNININLFTTVILCGLGVFACNLPIVEPTFSTRARFKLLAPDTCFIPCNISTENTSHNALSYEWNFGDNTFSTEMNPMHSYLKEGDYEITLTATGQDSVDVSPPEKITVLDAPNRFKRIYSPGLNLGPLTDIIQLEDQSYVVVGFSGQIFRIDNAGRRENFWSFKHGSETHANFYGVIEDLNGDLVVIENIAQNFFDKSKAAFLKVNLETGVKLGGAVRIVNSNDEVAATGIDLNKQTGEYLICGETINSNSPNSSSLFLLTQPRIGQGVMGIFSGFQEVIGGEVYYVDGLGSIMGGRELAESSADFKSSLYINNLPYNFEQKGIRFGTFTPLSNGEIAVLEGEFSPGLQIWILRQDGKWKSTPINITQTGFTEHKAIKIIERREGGFAGIALAKNGFLVQQKDIVEPSSIFFMTDIGGTILALKTIGGSSNSSNFLMDIMQLDDGGYIMVGSEDGDPMVIRADSTGSFPQ